MLWLPFIQLFFAIGFSQPQDTPSLSKRLTAAEDTTEEVSGIEKYYQDNKDEYTDYYGQTDMDRYDEDDTADYYAVAVKDDPVEDHEDFIEMLTVPLTKSYDEVGPDEFVEDFQMTSGQNLIVKEIFRNAFWEEAKIYLGEDPDDLVKSGKDLSDSELLWYEWSANLFDGEQMAGSTEGEIDTFFRDVKARAFTRLFNTLYYRDVDDGTVCGLTSDDDVCLYTVMKRNDESSDDSTDSDI